jgi:polyphosphate kinase
VRIYLIVRGICSLRPGIPGISDNITVKSIVGRFLEHSRIFWFYNDGEERFYLSSADLMSRNLDRRVETFFPVINKDLKKELWEIIQGNIKDNVKGRIMQPDGTYIKDNAGSERFNVQEFYMKKVSSPVKKKQKKIFIPKSKEDI